MAFNRRNNAGFMPKQVYFVAATVLPVLLQLFFVSASQGAMSLADIEEKWRNKQYAQVLSPLLKYGQEHGDDPKVDYLIGTSACQVPGQGVHGTAVLRAMLSRYKLDDAKQTKVRQEIERCGSMLEYFARLQTFDGSRSDAPSPSAPTDKPASTGPRASVSIKDGASIDAGDAGQHSVFGTPMLLPPDSWDYPLPEKEPIRSPQREVPGVPQLGGSEYLQAAREVSPAAEDIEHSSRSLTDQIPTQRLADPDVAAANKPIVSKSPGTVLTPGATLKPGTTLAPGSTLTPGSTLSPQTTLTPGEFNPRSTLNPGTLPNAGTPLQKSPTIQKPR